MPDTIATHWGIYGEPDGYSPKLVGLFLMPLLSVFMFILFLVIPKIDPLKKNVTAFRKHFDRFIVVIFGFLFYLYLLTLFWNLGYKFNMIQFLVPAFGLLFYMTSDLLGKAKRNWFIGIRTPWTLTSDIVWEKTHKLGMKLFRLAGVISFAGVIFPNYAVYFILAPILFFTAYLFAYSYYEYRKI